MYRGIDVSAHQGTIDWDSVKSNIDFAILRGGFGDNIIGQDDKQFSRNVSECARLGIPYGIYLYSYADSEAHINSEIEHIERLLEGKNPFAVYIDMEDAKTICVGKLALTEYALRFCRNVHAAGFKAGVYANQNWCQNYLDIARIHSEGFSVWCAKYSDSEPNIACPYDIWQYSSSGSISGIAGRVDMNHGYNCLWEVAPAPIPTPVPERFTNEQLADQIIAGQGGWGNNPERANKLTAAGYDAQAVQAIINSRYEKPQEVTYTVKAGDTLSAIAKKYGTTCNALAVKNGIKNINKIFVGQVIKI